MITPAGLLKYYGNDNQIKKTIEECTELSLALQHYLDGKATVDEVITELADIKNMMPQMDIIFGADAVNDEAEHKLKRQSERLRWE